MAKEAFLTFHFNDDMAHARRNDLCCTAGAALRVNTIMFGPVTDSAEICVESGVCNDLRSLSVSTAGRTSSMTRQLVAVCTSN